MNPTFAAYTDIVLQLHDNHHRTPINIVRSTFSPTSILVTARCTQLNLRPATPLTRTLHTLLSLDQPHAPHASINGGLTKLFFATSILTQFQHRHEHHHHTHYFQPLPVLVQQLRHGLHVAEQIIVHRSQRIKLSDLSAMKNIITTMLYPNVITFMGVHQAKQREHVASVILDAMLSSLDPKTAEPCVRIVVVEGSNCMDSFSAPNVVLMDIPLPHVHARRWTINRGKGFNIAVFDTTLDSIPRVAPPSSSIKDTGEDTGEAAFASAMQQAEVHIVVSQKVIPRHLQRRLRACGIVAIERLSLRYIRAVACVSGAQVLGQTALRVMCTTTTTTTAPQTTAAASASPSQYGKLQSICIRRIGNKKYVQFKGYPDMSRPLSTLVLRAPSKHSLLELEDTVQHVLAVLPHLFRSPHVYPHNGTGELYIANKLMLENEHGKNAGHQILAKTFERMGRMVNQMEDAKSTNGLLITTLYVQELKQALAAAVACIRTL